MIVYDFDIRFRNVDIDEFKIFYNYVGYLQARNSFQKCNLRRVNKKE